MNDKIYVSTVNGESFYKYHPLTDSWTEIRSIPSSPFCSSVGELVAVNDKIYFMGCFRSGSQSMISMEYDPSGDSWREIVSIGTPFRYETTNTVYNNKIYVSGGSSSLRTMESYDPTSNTWEKLASLPSTMSPYYSIIKAVGDKIYAIGETNTSIYDISSDTWSNGVGRPMPSSHSSGETIDSKIYILGGYKAEKDMFIFTP